MELLIMIILIYLVTQELVEGSYHLRLMWVKIYITMGKNVK